MPTETNSHGYKCPSTGPTGCVRIDTQTADDGEIGYTSLGHGATFGSAVLWASTKNPLLPPEIAPAIDTRVTIYISDTRSYVKGYHDNMPKHEFYIGPYPGEYIKIYESPYINWAFNLGCLSAEPNVQIPLCSTNFNAMI